MAGKVKLTFDASRYGSYYNDYYDQNASNNPSDIQKQYYADLAMAQTTWNHDQWWYQNFMSPEAMMKQYRDLGLNPLSSARAILGSGLSADAPSAPGTISGSGANSALSQVLDAFANGTNAVMTGMQTDMQRDLTHAQSANLASQTANNIAQNPYIAPKMKSEITKNEMQAAESSAQVGVLNETQKKIIQDAKLSEEQTRLVGLQADKYLEYSAAQINVWENQAALYFEQALTETHKQTNLDAETELLGAQTAETRANTQFINQETQQLMTINEFCAATGIPLAADTRRALEYFESKGDIGSAKRVLLTSFDVATAHEAGVQDVQVSAEDSKSYNNARNNYIWSDPSSAFGTVYRLGTGHYNLRHMTSFKGTRNPDFYVVPHIK